MQRDYEQNILKGIQQDMIKERAKEKAIRLRDFENTRGVREQNDRHLEHRREQRAKEDEIMARLEKQAAEIDARKAQEREMAFKATYARQARQYAATSTMQEIMQAQADADEARALKHARENEEKAAAVEAAKTSKRAALQKDCLDVLAIQVREKQVRTQAQASRNQIIADRAKAELQKSIDSETRRRDANLARRDRYKSDLLAQMRAHEERKTLEPFLLSKAERQMNASLLSQLP